MVILLAAEDTSSGTVQIVALIVGLVQAVALAVIADRSRRVRQDDERRRPPECPPEDDGVAPD